MIFSNKKRYGSGLCKVLIRVIRIPLDFEQVYILPNIKQPWEGNYFPSTLLQLRTNLLDSQLQKKNSSESQDRLVQAIVSLAKIIEKWIQKGTNWCRNASSPPKRDDKKGIVKSSKRIPEMSPKCIRECKKYFSQLFFSQPKN